eukprot:15434415-Alexandrium_andersonii.AAC.2
MKDILSDLSDAKAHRLAGNGMHLPSVLAVFFFALSNMVWLEECAVAKPEVPLGRKGGTTFFEDSYVDAQSEMQAGDC